MAKRKIHKSLKTKAKFNKKTDESTVDWDDEDAFHDARDRILLEGEEQQLSEDELDNEVFALPNAHDSDQESVNQGDEGSVGETPTPALSPRKKKPKKAPAEPDDNSSEDDRESEQEESWGRKKSVYYSTNAAQIDSDDEEAQKLEEAEVLRLQAQARDALDEADFGLFDAPSLSKDALEDQLAVSSAAPSIPEDPQAIVRHLQMTNPEALALARDWEDVAEDLITAHRAIQKTQKKSLNDPSLGMAHLYHQTLLTYATTLAFYLHLRASPKYALNPTSLRAHPILPRLLVLKQALSALENLDFGPAASDISHLSDIGEGDFDMEEDMANVWGLPGFRTMLDDDELNELLRDAQLRSPEPNDLDHPKEKKTKKRKEKEEGTRKKDKKKEKKADKRTDGIFDLVEPEFIPSSSKAKAYTPATSTAGLPFALSAYGEATALNEIDAEDKSARKRSLRFHTSKIESTTARRAHARDAARGGDDDIPYRERDKAREARLKREAEARLERGLLGRGGDDLEDVDMESGGGDDDDKRKGEGSKKRRREEMEEGDEDALESGYYELVKRQKKEQKEQKKAEYKAEKAAEQVGREDNDESANGPRSLTRAILKNKGLTPHRSKSVRNPRVKKRQKYEDAKKKIRSQKAVYKGGLASTGGRYDGEASGISVRTVKSVKLG